MRATPAVILCIQYVVRGIPWYVRTALTEDGRGHLDGSSDHPTRQSAPTGTHRGSHTPPPSAEVHASAPRAPNAAHVGAWVRADGRQSFAFRFFPPESLNLGVRNAHPSLRHFLRFDERAAQSVGGGGASALSRASSEATRHEPPCHSQPAAVPVPPAAAHADSPIAPAAQVACASATAPHACHVAAPGPPTLARDGSFSCICGCA